MKASDPHCNNCGHTLTGLVDSSKCPECGRPIVEVLVRGGPRGKRFRSKATLFGRPLIDVALGPHEDESIGRARGIIAVGDVAVGWIAVGGRSRGFVAFGGLAMGFFAFGGVALGVIGGWGGMALGLLVSGGMAIGGLASGGGAVGYVATGGGAAGVYAAGGGYYSLVKARSPEWVAVFDRLSWYFGQTPLTSMFQPMIVIIGLGLFAAGAIGLVVLIANARFERSDNGNPYRS